MIATKARLHPLYEALLGKAADYLALYCAEKECPDLYQPRLAEIEAEIAATGTYQQTFAELEHGARVAWRNSTRCVGRLYWPCLQLLDFRASTTAEEMERDLATYLRTATNGGNLRPTIAVFAPRQAGRPGPRIWNEQLIRYAGYRQRDGSVLGDPRQVEITAEVLKLGWAPAERTAFDVMPLVLQLPDAEPHLFTLPAEEVLEVPLAHPELPWFAELGLRWHALPAISGMRLEVGGIDYTLAPFNGWYMGAEIGARNLADVDRYNLLPVVAARLGLDTAHERSLWRDRALVEINIAVLHSFEQAGVKMVDHHTVSDHFLKFEEKEAQCGRRTYADWSWVVPPISGATSPLFHHPFVDREQTPNFFYQPAAWRTDGSPALPKKCPFHPLVADRD